MKRNLKTPARALVSIGDIVADDERLSSRFGKIRTIRSFKSGSRSFVNLITAERGLFVLKRKRSGTKDYREEYDNLLVNSRKSLSPKPYAYGTKGTTDYLALEYINGNRLRKRGMATEDIKAVARLLDKVLKPAPGTVDLVERMNWDGDYAKRWTAEAAKYSPLRKDALRAKELFERVPSPQKITVENRYRHGDPNPHNFIKKGKRIVLVDWENHSRPGPGEIELADFAIKAHLTAEKRERWTGLFSWCERDIFEIAYRYRLASIIGWHFERLVRHHQGTFTEPFFGGNKDAEVKTMRSLIVELERAL